MADYKHIICVDGNDFEWIIKGFAVLVQSKHLKSIPYKDFTRLKKFNKEVEFRFDPSNGTVMIVPTDISLSHLWWGKKDDESLGSYLWDHFKEELKEMDEKIYKTSDKDYAYDIFGNYKPVKYNADPAALEAISALTEKYNNQDCLATSTSDSTITTYLGDPYTSIDGTISKAVSTSTSEQLMNIKEDIEKLQNNQEELQDKVNTKPNFRDVENIVEDVTYGLCGEIEDIRYELRMFADRIAALEEKSKQPPLECETNKIVVYDVNGLPHEAEVKLQSTSSSSYPVRNYNINIPGMSGSNERKEKENNMDTNKMFNFDFGPVASHIRMSPYGLAMKNADGKYVSYDKTTGSVMDVEIFNFDAQKFLYKMPVAVNQVAVGDIVVHMRKPMFVRAVKDGVVSVIDIYNAEAKDILPVKSPFGFNFITKVVSLIDMTGADANSPFGNMLPLLMLGKGQDFKDILPLMLLTGNAGANAMSNPLMLYALMSDGNKDMLPFLFMMGNNPFAPATAQNCGCQGHEADGQCCNG